MNTREDRSRWTKEWTLTERERTDDSRQWRGTNRVEKFEQSRWLSIILVLRRMHTYNPAPRAKHYGSETLKEMKQSLGRGA